MCKPLFPSKIYFLAGVSKQMSHEFEKVWRLLEQSRDFPSPLISSFKQWIKSNNFEFHFHMFINDVRGDDNQSLTIQWLKTNGCPNIQNIKQVILSSSIEEEEKKIPADNNTNAGNSRKKNRTKMPRNIYNDHKKYIDVSFALAYIHTHIHTIINKHTNYTNLTTV